MDVFTIWLAVLSAIVLGLAAGAVVAEAAILVPYWRAMKPASFLAWYRDYAGLLFKFFAPLEIAAALSAIAALVAGWVAGAARLTWLAAAALLAFAVLLVFPLYFQRVNASFEAGTIAEEKVPGELGRWARWHWLRCAMGVGAFVAATVALTGCAALQTGGSSQPPATAAKNTAAKAATASAPQKAPAAAPASSASGVYSVTFGISARTSRLGAVQFDAKAKGASGWQGAGAAVACRNVSGAAMMACNNKGGGLLSCALIDPSGIGTPKDLVTCRFSSSKAVGAGDFTIKVTDASSPDMKPVAVSVVVTRVAGH